MAWKIFCAHHVAHLQPTITRGTPDTGFPKGNCRTLEIDSRAEFAGATTPALQIDFDRGHTDGENVNAILVLGNNLNGSSIDVFEADNSGFSSATTLLSAYTDVKRMMYADLAGSTGEQFLRFEYNGSVGTIQIGVLSIGKVYDLATTGPQLNTQRGTAVRRTPTSGHPRDSAERFVRSFRVVDEADAKSILEASAKWYIMNAAETAIDGFGLAGGELPLALIDTVGDGGNPKVYWGVGTVAISPWAAGLSEVFVDLEQIKEGVLF